MIDLVSDQAHMYIAKRKARNEPLDSYMGIRGQINHEYSVQ